MEQLQTKTSKQLFDILETAARLHDNLNTELPREEVICDIIPYIEKAMEHLGYELTRPEEHINTKKRAAKKKTNQKSIRASIKRSHSVRE